MKINRGSWHYRLWTFYFRQLGIDIPKQISLCRYFWEMVWTVCVRLPFMVVGAIIMGVVWLVATLLAPLFGYLPKRELLEYKEYGLPKVRGHKLLPIYPVLAGLLVWWSYVAIPESANKPLHELEGGAAWYKAFLFGVAAVSVSGLFVWAKTKIEESESWRLLQAFLKAKKERVCPILEFVGEGWIGKTDEEGETE